VVAREACQECRERYAGSVGVASIWLEGGADLGKRSSEESGSSGTVGRAGAPAGINATFELTVLNPMRLNFDLGCV